MSKYIRLIKTCGEIEDMETTFEYTVGETISVNNSHNIYKCTDIKTDNDKTYYCFKQGIKTYSFDW